MHQRELKNQADAKLTENIKSCANRNERDTWPYPVPLSMTTAGREAASMEESAVAIRRGRTAHSSGAIGWSSGRALGFCFALPSETAVQIYRQSGAPPSPTLHDLTNTSLAFSCVCLIFQSRSVESRSYRPTNNVLISIKILHLIFF